MDHKIQRSWADFLNPEILRMNLVTASIYIAAFELLKRTIVDGVRSFYTTRFDENSPRVDPKYHSEVQSKNKSIAYASLEWLKESHAIDESDIAIFETVRRCRNDITHEILRKLTDGLPSDLPTRFSEIFLLLDKIERWWIINVHIPTDPQFDGQEIDEHGIVPGPVMMLQLMVDIALGSQEDSRKYLDEFNKHIEHRGS